VELGRANLFSVLFQTAINHVDDRFQLAADRQTIAEAERKTACCLCTVEAERCRKTGAKCREDPFETEKGVLY